MTIDKEIYSLLKLLKNSGISYKAFAQVSGISPRTIYALTAPPKLTKSQAETIIHAAQTYFPVQYTQAIQQLDSVNNQTQS